MTFFDKGSEAYQAQVILYVLQTFDSDFGVLLRILEKLFSAPPNVWERVGQTWKLDTFDEMKPEYILILLQVGTSERPEMIAALCKGLNNQSSEKAKEVAISLNHYLLAYFEKQAKQLGKS